MDTFFIRDVLLVCQKFFDNKWGHRVGLGVWCDFSGEAVGLAGTLSQ